MDLYNLACVFGAWCYRILVFTMLIPNINSRFSINKHKFLFNACIYSDWFYSSALILFVGVFSCRYLLEYGKFWELIYIHSTTFLAIMGSFIVFHIFAKDLLARFRPLLSHLGRMTLPIYMLHIMFVIQIPAIGEFIIVQNAVTSIVLQIIYSAVISIISVRYKPMGNPMGISFSVYLLPNLTF